LAIPVGSRQPGGHASRIRSEERASVDRTGRPQVETPPTSRNAVLNSLAAASSQESHAHAIDESIGWYCSEPRLAFNRSVFLRYRFFLEQKNPAPSTINVRLAAVRRLAFEAADTGLLSPELGSHWRKPVYRVFLSERPTLVRVRFRPDISIRHLPRRGANPISFGGLSRPHESLARTFSTTGWTPNNPSPLFG
jgi:hypothetical protein